MHFNFDLIAILAEEVKLSKTYISIISAAKMIQGLVNDEYDVPVAINMLIASADYA